MAQSSEEIERSQSLANKQDLTDSEAVEIVTMVDVVKEEEELEDCTKALLGASDDKNCTYAKGYMKRQALYVCITCTPHGNESEQPGGICLACSYHCHEGHELIELYTKRNFRCDCGNQKFQNHKCNLEPNKSAVNDKNRYNQNFHGVYCVCKRPYPDPEEKNSDSMLQCIICEDWYHEKHLGAETTLSVEDGELVCHLCMEKNHFLNRYASSEGFTEDEGCRLKIVECENAGAGKTTIFSEGWRGKLCKCQKCLDMYEDKGLYFLLDEEDTVQTYEARGKACSETQYDLGMKALNSMDRVQTVEAIKGYNDMKTQLMGYLQKFAESNKVVREEDIREFFSGMEARKKKRVDEVQIPYFCR